MDLINYYNGISIHYCPPVVLKLFNHLADCHVDMLCLTPGIIFTPDTVTYLVTYSCSVLLPHEVGQMQLARVGKRQTTRLGGSDALGSESMSPLHSFAKKADFPVPVGAKTTTF